MLILPHAFERLHLSQKHFWSIAFEQSLFKQFYMPHFKFYLFNITWQVISNTHLLLWFGLAKRTNIIIILFYKCSFLLGCNLKDTVIIWQVNRYYNYEEKYVVNYESCKIYFPTQYLITVELKFMNWIEKNLVIILQFYTT